MSIFRIKLSLDVFIFLVKASSTCQVCTSCWQKWALHGFWGSFPIVLVQDCLDIRLWCSGVRCGKDGSVDNHMEMGKKLLAAGQLADALSHFHAAVGETHTDRLYIFMDFSESAHLSLHFLSRFVRWRSEELHGILQESYSVPSNGEVKVCSSRFKQSHWTKARFHICELSILHLSQIIFVTHCLLSHFHALTIGSKINSNWYLAIKF